MNYVVNNGKYTVKTQIIEGIEFTNNTGKKFMVPLKEIENFINAISKVKYTDIFEDIIKYTEITNDEKKNDIETKRREIKSLEESGSQGNENNKNKKINKLTNEIAGLNNKIAENVNMINKFKDLKNTINASDKTFFNYDEKIWRIVMGQIIDDKRTNSQDEAGPESNQTEEIENAMPSLKSIYGSQTKPILNAVNYVVKKQIIGKEPEPKTFSLGEEGNLILLSPDELSKYKNKSGSSVRDFLLIPKPFLLLAGISGTGKTRFVREQARLSAGEYHLDGGSNFCLVPVRPDWHEPSDLLGYISRISGVRYVATDFLKFLVLAWFHAAASVDENNIILKSVGDIPPFWLCLDEMNLAPVEQYFADYLSVLETRKWRGGINDYSCEPVLKAGVFQELEQSIDSKDDNPFEVFWQSVRPSCAGNNNDLEDSLKNYFKKNGIPLPPNLIVAGTVNMDETTHGFSRKVIDRALTLDFQEFFPNNYDEFFSEDEKSSMKKLSFPAISKVCLNDLQGTADLKNKPGNPQSSEGEEEDNQDGAAVTVQSGQDELIPSLSREFLKNLNEILKDTPFELGFRALNELLLSVVCLKPDDDETLCAVWDDFLMQKVLPRIEGDTQKLKSLHGAKVVGLDEGIYGSGSILHDLYSFLQSEKALQKIWDDKKGSRPDLLMERQGNIKCRTKKKLEWMMRRLRTRRSTDFWV